MNKRKGVKLKHTANHTDNDIGLDWFYYGTKIRHLEGTLRNVQGDTMEIWVGCGVGDEIIKTDYEDGIGKIYMKPFDGDVRIALLNVEKAYFPAKTKRIEIYDNT